jgi:cystathionine beta-lyase
MNFDIVIDRSGTDTSKWERVDKEAGKEGVIPLWVADMDFPSPPAVTAALRERAAHPIYGYTRLSQDYFEILASWHRDRYGLDLEPGHFLAAPGVVPSLGLAVRALSRPGDGVLILTPVYHPFFDMIRFNGRETAEVPMTLDSRGRYSFDADSLEAGLAAARERGLRVSLALFCSPHNPGGTVWDREELELFLQFAQKNGITVVSDEIHSDFVYSPKTFCSMAALTEYADRVVVVSGANKSFNLGGLRLSHCLTRDPALAEALREGCRSMAFDGPDIFSLIAVKAAYREGGPWLAELKAYIGKNIEAAVAEINAGIPGARAYTPEGTYLIWADVRELIDRGGFRDDRDFAGLLEREGRVKVTPGSAFGGEGRGFIRINAACPRSLLMEGMRRFKVWSAAR